MSRKRELDPYDDPNCERTLSPEEKRERARKQREVDVALEYALVNAQPEDIMPDFGALFAGPKRSVPVKHVNPEPIDEHTAKEARFVQAYIRLGNNAIEAAKAAGYERPHFTGPNLLKKSSVKQTLKHVLAAQLEAADLTPGRVALEIARVALANQQDFIDADGAAIPLHLLPRDLAAAVQSVDAYGRPRLYDKLKALTEAKDILGMSKKSVDVSVSGNVSHSHSINLDTLSPSDIDALLDLADVIDVTPE